MTIQYRLAVAVILLLAAQVVPANYAVIIQDDSSKTYYKTLKKRGFIDENIYQEKLVPIQELQSKINKSPAPFYLIMLGKDDNIDISNWLDELEAGLNEEAKKQARVVILSNTIKGISKAGRVIISSAAADEEVSEGPNSNDIFLENFFQHLARGVSINKAFEKSSNITKKFTRSISTESYPRSLAFLSSGLKVNIPMLGTWKYQGGSNFNKVAYEPGCSCP
jgi:hypothetical protein